MERLFECKSDNDSDEIGDLDEEYVDLLKQANKYYHEREKIKVEIKDMKK